MKQRRDVPRAVPSLRNTSMRGLLGIPGGHGCNPSQKSRTNGTQPPIMAGRNSPGTFSQACDPGPVAADNFIRACPDGRYRGLTLMEADMSIRDDLTAITAPAKSGFDLWFDTLNKDDRDALTEAAPLAKISHRAFHDVVKAHGATVGKERITTWRKNLGFPS